MADWSRCYLRRKSHLVWELLLPDRNDEAYILGTIEQWVGSLNRPIQMFGYTAYDGKKARAPRWNTARKAAQALCDYAHRSLMAKSKAGDF